MITRYLLLFSVFVSVALAGRYWDQWAAGNGGVHSNPVFKTKPHIRWTFNYNYTYNDGVVTIDNQEHAIYMANGEAGKTGYWKLSWSGQILSSWKTPWNTIFDGTMGARNGVVYIYSGSRRTLYAVNETTTELLWNKTDLVTSMNPYSNSPLEWNKDSSILYISTANQIHAITASTGDIIWSTQPTSSQTAVAPLIRSTLDNTFVVNYYNNTVAKYKVSTGELVWTTSLVGSEWKTPSPPTVDNSDGSIYVTTFIDGVYKLNINGQIVWQKNDFIGWFHYFSPILFNTDYVLIVGCTTGMKLYKKSNGDSVDVFGYDYVDQQNNVRNQVFTQPLFNRDQNVLYFVYSDNGTLVALDTSNINGFTVMWSLDTLLIKHSGNGPSIASDGTIFLATAWRDWPIGLVSIGCPITKQVSSDGLTCVCAPAFVASGDSCVCSDNTKEPSEDGLSCVDKPIVPGVDSPSSPNLPPSTTSSPTSSNTPSRPNTPGSTNAPNSSVTSDAATIGLGLMMVVLLIVDVML